MDWDIEQVSLAKREPRHGRRLTLAATVHCPNSTPVMVYSVHLEVSDKEWCTFSLCYLIGREIRHFLLAFCNTATELTESYTKDKVSWLMNGGVQVFCGMLSRIAQFADVMLDAKQQIDKVG